MTKTCMVCGKKYIADLRPHLRAHNMNIREYEALHGRTESWNIKCRYDGERAHIDL